MFVGRFGPEAVDATRRGSNRMAKVRGYAPPEPRHAGLRSGSPVSPSTCPTRQEARPVRSERAAASISATSADAPALRRLWAFAARTGGATKPAGTALTMG
ncbi:hypothetical protein GCM10007890_44730 [Methylobacterium tardum]|uniref:Uncharacterized protein n=1 Tax=Methylobacterium tardum TaxID=374432 RepID=A0AA37TJJ1_9HYPH|nr:hypothetical protein AwMethylo_05690 [Methylobacterium sp.]GLS72458.1 hypothetical protein GCM10007890_44730 [Methylobacterium tardum]